MEKKICKEPDPLQLLREGNRELLESLYGNYRKIFISFAVFKYYCHPEDAKDAFQEAVIIVYEKAKHELDFSLRYSIKTYIFEVAEHLLNNIIRDKISIIKLDLFLHDLFAEEEPAENPEKDELVAQIVKKCRKLLSKTERKIIDLRYFKKLPWAKIACKMNLSEKYLRNKNHEIKEAFQKFCFDNGWAENLFFG